MSERRRISRVTTRTGDKGTTSLATGRRLGKHEQHMRAIGAVDELNSHIGLLEALVEHQHQQSLREIQQSLFDMGAVFAMEGDYPAPDLEPVEALTNSMNADLPALTEFVLPRGGQAASQAHVCRAVCRRAEIEVWARINEMDEPPAAYQGAVRYLNRLSDLFFVLARLLSQGEEQQWQGPTKA